MKLKWRAERGNWWNYGYIPSQDFRYDWALRPMRLLQDVLRGKK